MKQTIRLIAICILLVFSDNVANAQYVIHIAGANMPGHLGDSSEAIHASLRCPTSVCRDAANNLYIADGGPLGYLNDGCVRKIDALSGIITTIAGVLYAADTPSNTADSILATNAKLQGCASVCMDKNGDLLIADGYSCIMKVNLTTGYITHLAGKRGSAGYMGDGGLATAALLDGPCDVAVDANNNIYIADLHNNVIRRVSAINGIISTVAGKGAIGFSGDGGPAVLAKLNQPHGVYVANNGDMYIADYYNNRVRKVGASSGIITTIAGDGGPGFDGDGGPATDARLSQPVRVTMDQHGTLFIADAANQRVRRILSGTISTYAGNGKYFSGPDIIGDDGPATAAMIDPYGMCFDQCDNLYLGSALYSIRAVTPGAIPYGGELCGLKTNDVAAIPNAIVTEVKVYPNPNSGSCIVDITSPANESVRITVTDVMGRTVLSVAAITNKKTELKLNVPSGMYLLNVSGANARTMTKIVVE